MAFSFHAYRRPMHSSRGHVQAAGTHLPTWCANPATPMLLFVRAARRPATMVPWLCLQGVRRGTAGAEVSGSPRLVRRR